MPSFPWFCLKLNPVFDNPNSKPRGIEMKTGFAVAVLFCCFTTGAVAQDKPQDAPQDKPQEKKDDGGGQCLIVAPHPVFKYQFRDSYNLAKENVKDLYKSSDLTDLRKAGVHVIII